MAAITWFFENLHAEVAKLDATGANDALFSGNVGVIMLALGTVASGHVIALMGAAIPGLLIHLTALDAELRLARAAGHLRTARLFHAIRVTLRTRLATQRLLQLLKLLIRRFILLLPFRHLLAGKPFVFVRLALLTEFVLAAAFHTGIRRFILQGFVALRTAVNVLCLPNEDQRSSLFHQTILLLVGDDVIDVFIRDEGAASGVRA